MPIQLSNCCKAPIDLNPQLDRPECYTCIECGRVIGSPTPEKSVEEKKKYQNLVDDGFCHHGTETENYRRTKKLISTIIDDYTQTLQTERQRCEERVEEAYKKGKGIPTETKVYLRRKGNRFFARTKMGKETIDDVEISEEEYKALTQPNNSNETEWEARERAGEKPFDNPK